MVPRKRYFLKENYKYVVVSATPLKAKPKEVCPLESECLFGEKILVKEQHDDWIYGTLKTDNYSGWIKSNHLGKYIAPTHRVIAIRTFVYKDKQIKSGTFIYLPMGAQVKLRETIGIWSKILIVNNNRITNGFVLTKDLAKLDSVVSDWVKIAQSLIGVPYKWGGRDTIGIDCSALIQLSLQTICFAAPRNSDKQSKICVSKNLNVNELTRGHIICWPDHIGIMINSKIILHANAFHMKVVEEPLKSVIKRSKNDIINIFKIKKIIKTRIV